MAMKINSDDDEEDYALFGKIVLLWGHVEAALVNILLRVTHPLNKLPNHDGVPTPFSQKIKLAKRGYRDIEKLTSIKSEAYEILASLRPIHDRRSIIVHGYYQGFTGSNNQFMFGLYKSHGPLRERALKFHYFTRQEIRQLISDIEACRRKLDALSDNTFRLCP
jgi:hypothetical protein